MTAVAARIRRPALWMVYPALGALVCLLYAFVPPIAGNGFVVPGVGLSCSIAIVCGTRRNKPDAAWAWYLFAVGQFMFAMGDAYTYIYPRVFGADVPFPSWGDAIYLSLYPALFGGIFILARRRNPSGEWASLIDSLILTIGLGLISWLVLISPVIHDDSQTQLARIVSIAYPTADILLLAGALRLAVDNGKRQPAFYLLFGSITTLLVDRLHLRRDAEQRHLQRPGAARHRLDLLLPALGHLGPAPVDAHPRGAGAGEGDEPVLAAAGSAHGRLADRSRPAGAARRARMPAWTCWS